MKNIALTCKLFDQDAFYFIKPIADLQNINSITVYRDRITDYHPKVKFITPYRLPIKSFRFLIRIFQMIKSNPKSELFIGIYEIPHGLIAMIAGKLSRKPIVVNIIGNPAYKKIRKGIRKKITYWILRNVDIITTTGSISKKFLVNEGFDESKIFELPNSIDINFFKPNDNIPKKYDIINLGRLSPEKRLIDFVKIISIIQKQIPNIQVAIAGIGSEKENIVREIDRYNLSNNIKMLGYIENSTIVDFLNSGKIFMMCSETEGFPRTIIQSLACGTPCVISEVGDIPDLIIHGKTGFLITKPENHNDFVKYTIHLLTNLELYQEIKKNGLSHVRQKYSYEASSRVWEKIIEKILK